MLPQYLVLQNAIKELSNVMKNNNFFKKISSWNSSSFVEYQMLYVSYDNTFNGICNG